MSQGRIIIVSGPSGVGKGTILRTVMQQHESLHYSVSATSRPMRPEDREGVSYYFVSRERFEEMIAAGELLEHACYAGNYYGTPLRPVEEALARGESVVLEIDVQGALQVMQRRPDAISVFIAPPSYAELKRRLAGRGDTPPDIAARRLHIALEECRQAKHYQYTIINDSVGHAVQELEAVLTAEACRTSIAHSISRRKTNYAVSRYGRSAQAHRQPLSSRQCDRAPRAPDLHRGRDGAHPAGG